MIMASPPKRLQLDTPTKQDQCSGSHDHGRHQTSTEFWLQSIHTCYHDLHKRTYFCPPLPHFNRVHYTSRTVANLTVLVPEKPPGSASESHQNAQVSSSAQTICAQMSSLPQTSLCQPSCELSSTLATSQSTHSQPLNAHALETVESQPGLSLSSNVRPLTQPSDRQQSTVSYCTGPFSPQCPPTHSSVETTHPFSDSPRSQQYSNFQTVNSLSPIIENQFAFTAFTKVEHSGTEPVVEQPLFPLSLFEQRLSSVVSSTTVTTPTQMSSLLGQSQPLRCSPEPNRSKLSTQSQHQGLSHRSLSFTQQSFQSQPHQLFQSGMELKHQESLGILLSDQTRVSAHSSHGHQSINSQCLYLPARDEQCTQDQPDQPNQLCYSQQSTPWQDQRYQSQQSTQSSDQLAHNSIYPHHEQRALSQQNYHIINSQQTHTSERLQEPYQFMQTAQQTMQSQQFQKSALSVQKQHSAQTHQSILSPQVLHDPQAQSVQLQLSHQLHHLKRDALRQRSTTHFNQSHTLPSRHVHNSMQSHQYRQSKLGLFPHEMQQPSQSLQSCNLGHLQESPQTQQASQSRRPNISPIESSILSRQSYQTNVLQPHLVQKTTHSIQSQQTHQSIQSHWSQQMHQSSQSHQSQQMHQYIQSHPSQQMRQSIQSQQTHQSIQSHQSQQLHQFIQSHPSQQIHESIQSYQSQQMHQFIQSQQMHESIQSHWSEQMHQSIQSRQSQQMHQYSQSHQSQKMHQSIQSCQSRQMHRYSQSHQSQEMLRSIQSQQMHQSSQSHQSQHMNQFGQSHQSQQMHQFGQSHQSQQMHQFGQSHPSQQMHQSSQPHQSQQMHQSSQSHQSQQMHQFGQSHPLQEMHPFGQSYPSQEMHQFGQSHQSQQMHQFDQSYPSQEMHQSIQLQQMHQSSQSRPPNQSHILQSHVLQESLLPGQSREVVQPLQSGSLSHSQHYLHSQQPKESTESRQTQQRHHPVQLRHLNHSQNLHHVQESACSSQSPQIQQAMQSIKTPQDEQTEQSQQVQNTHTYKMWKSHAVRKLPIVIDSHVRDDNALHRVLACLDEMSKDGKEVMMVISQLEFGHYLDKPSYAAAASLLPRPVTLGEGYQRGDFDLLIIHSKCGIVTAEIKSVGDNFDQLHLTDFQKDAILIKTVTKALNQLNKSGEVLSHLVSDMQNMKIIKTLILANVKEDQLRRAVTSDPKTQQSLCDCLEVNTLDDAIQLCLLSEDLSEKDAPWEVTPSKIRFQNWWQRRVLDSGRQVSMTPKMYEHLVARFCGPATTIFIHCISAPRLELRTEWESVSETGERMAGLVLFPDQVELLNSSRPLVFLSGPPGTGKTVVLTIKGLAWLQKGFDVHVISIYPDSRAVSIVIEHQLRQSWSENTPNIFRLEYNFENDLESEKAAKSLANSTNENGTLCAIVDEASRFYEGDIFNLNRFQVFEMFCEKLLSEVPSLFLWAAAVEHGAKPSGFAEFTFRTPLRSPPAVIREVVTTREMKVSKRSNDKFFLKGDWNIRPKSVHKYASCKTPVPTHGPQFKRIRHNTRNKLGHTGKKSFECSECGKQTAQILTDLKVGHACENELLYRDTNARNGPPPLQYRDVLVVWEVPRQNGREWDKKTLTDLGFIQGLRDNHIPVGVVLLNDEAALRDMALAVTDQVSVVERATVRGLERKVVIVAGDYRKKIRSCDRLHSASRCTSQLVFID